MRKFAVSILLLCLLSSTALANSVPFSLSHLSRTNIKAPLVFSAAEEAQIPVSYDLRNGNYVPPARAQGKWGTCWTFGVMAALETSYLHQMGATSNDFLHVETSDSMDLSEMHLAWYIAMAADRKQNFSMVNSKDKRLEKFPDAEQVMHNGGYINTSIAMMTRGYGWGPVMASSLPYETTGSDDVLDAYVKTFAKNPDHYPTVLRIKSAEYASDSSNEALMFSTPGNRNVIKYLIMTNGAASISYNAGNDPRFLNRTTGAYYYDVNEKSKDSDDIPANKTNHIVAIIGWDDNFPIENFNSASIRPKNPGAWLVRNSWGNVWPNKELAGCFWMSYEQYVEDGTTFVIEAADKNLRTYFHDDLGWCTSWGGNGKTATAANVFQAKSNGEILNEVGFYTTDNEAKVKIAVYKYGPVHPNNDILDKPAANAQIDTGYAELVAIASNDYTYAGYHTLSLDTPVTLNSGDYFSIVLEATNPSYQYPLAIEQRTNGYSDYALAFDGESYFLIDNQWVNGASLTQKSGDITEHVPANPCIKAFTVCNDGKIYLSEPNAGKSVDGIYVNILPAMTVSEDIINALNPAGGSNGYKGRVITQRVAGNDGKPIPEGTSIDVVMIYTNEFFEDTPTQTSKYGLMKGVHEIDPFYPEGFEPDAYVEEDGFLLPAYKISVVTSNDGRITIDANKAKLPAGFYDVVYMTLLSKDESADVELPSVIGMLRVSEITAAESGNNGTGGNGSNNNGTDNNGTDNNNNNNNNGTDNNNNNNNGTDNNGGNNNGSNSTPTATIIRTRDAHNIASLPASQVTQLTANGAMIGAILPVISVNASKFYTYDDVEAFSNIKISSDVPSGYVLKWNPFSEDKVASPVYDAADDDTVFYDADGKIIETVPANHTIKVSAWLESGKTYAPVITAVRSSDVGVGGAGGGCNSGFVMIGIAALGLAIFRLGSKR